MIRAVAALALAFGLGAICRFFEIPVPSPPKIFGAVLVVAITLGYTATDALLAKRCASETPPALARGSDRAP